MGLRDDALREWQQKLDRDKRERKEALDQLEALSRDYLARWSQTMGAPVEDLQVNAKETTDIVSQRTETELRFEWISEGLKFRMIVNGPGSVGTVDMYDDANSMWLRANFIADIGSILSGAAGQRARAASPMALR